MKLLDNYYPLIGKVVVRFQDVDLLVNIFMAGLLSEDPNVTMAFMVTLPFSKKLDVLRSVAPFKFGSQDLLDKLEMALPLLTKAEASRNRVVHAAWISSSAGEAVFFHKPKTTRKAGMKDGGISHATTAEIEAAITSMDAATTALCQLGHALEERNIMKTKMFADYETKKEP